MDNIIYRIRWDYIGSAEKVFKASDARRQGEIV